MNNHRTLLLMLFLFIMGNSSSEQIDNSKVTFIPHWLPQAQFAGYYVALDKGIFKKHGLDVQIIQGCPERPSDKMLEQGKVDFATMWLSTATQMRARGVKVVNLAQIIQRSAIMIIAKKSTGIVSPEDLNGKKIAIWRSGFKLPFNTFFDKYNIDVEIVPIQSSINLFLWDGVDAMSAMWFNEYHSILNAGLEPDELTTFFFPDYGINFPEDGLYCLEETYNKNPRLCCEFAKACIEGWEYSFEHSDEAIEIIMQYMYKAKEPANRAHQRWMLNCIKDLMHSEEGILEIGELNRQDYEYEANLLKVNGYIDSIPNFENFYRNCLNNEKQ